MLSELKPLIKVFARPGLPGFYLVNEWLKAKEQWRDFAPDPLAATSAS